jgi:hypothetical protein
MIDGLPLPSSAIVSETVANPAAGSQWTKTFSPGYQVLLLGVQYTVVADATVTNRYPGFEYSSAPVGFRVQYGVGIIKNQTYICVWLVGAAYIQTVTIDTHQMTLSYPIILNPGDVLSSDVVQLQPGDALRDIYLYYLQMPLTQ